MKLSFCKGDRGTINQGTHLGFEMAWRLYTEELAKQNKPEIRVYYPLSALLKQVNQNNQFHCS